jgi:phosphoenolpyruvate---glycerone phosphotransferase subunit DhaK
MLAQPAAAPRSTALLTGGRSGHDSFVTGFLGQGLLDGCVAGMVFASLTTTAVAALIRRVVDVIATATNEHLQGVCLVVLNYQGGRLNFARAARDVQEGPDALAVPVRMVVVCDDTWKGLPFHHIEGIADAASKAVFTIGVALHPATLPGSVEGCVRDVSPPGTATELGLGIHNEPGALVLPIGPANTTDYVDAVVGTICDRLGRAFSNKLGSLSRPLQAIAILVHNLGTVRHLPMGVVLHAVAGRVLCESRRQARPSK